MIRTMIIALPILAAIFASEAGASDEPQATPEMSPEVSLFIISSSRCRRRRVPRPAIHG